MSKKIFRKFDIMFKTFSKGGQLSIIFQTRSTCPLQIFLSESCQSLFQFKFENWIDMKAKRLFSHIFLDCLFQCLMKSNIIKNKGNTHLDTLIWQKWVWKTLTTVLINKSYWKFRISNFFVSFYRHFSSLLRILGFDRGKNGSSF